LLISDIIIPFATIALAELGDKSRILVFLLVGLVFIIFGGLTLFAKKKMMGGNHN